MNDSGTSISRRQFLGARPHVYNMPDEVDRLIESARYVASTWAYYMTSPTA